MAPGARWPPPLLRPSPMALPFRKQYVMHRNTRGRHSSTLTGPAWVNWCRTDCFGPARKSRRMNRPVSGLYAVTPEPADSLTLIGKVDAALRGGARIVQYRSKSPEQALRLSQAAEMARLCRRWNAMFIVNDSVELAREVDAD